MDLATLIKNVIDKLNQAKNQFKQSSDHASKKHQYNQFIEGLENLHKIYKTQAQHTTAQAANKIKEILKSAIKDADQMKKELDQTPQNVPTSHKSPNARKPPHNLKPIDKDQDQRNNALSGAIVKEKPNVKWEDVAGLESAKRALQEAIILPTKFPEIFIGIRQPWKGILLYGPPGTGKTFLAKACATQADSTFFSVSSSDLISKYVGESAKSIKTLFAMAREAKNAIIFIDEIDSLVSARSDNEDEASKKVKTEFLVQMQGVGNANDSGILVLGATNLPWALDSAIRRRFQKRIYIPLPDYEARFYLIKHKMEKEAHNLKENDFIEIAKLAEGFSGSDINQLIQNACYEPLRKFQKAIFFKQVGVNGKGEKVWQPCAPGEPGATKIDKNSLDQNTIQKNIIDKYDFLKAINNTKATVGKNDLQKYEEWTKDYGMKG